MSTRGNLTSRNNVNVCSSHAEDTVRSYECECLGSTTTFKTAMRPIRGAPSAKDPGKRGQF